jgi:hypothetical protein
MQPLRVQLDRPDRVYAPGDTVRAQISLTANGELPIRRLTAALVCTEHYQLRNSSTEGGEYLIVETSEQKYGERVLLEQAKLPAGQTESWSLEAKLPADAYPSYAGGVFQIEYSVRADADRERAVDLHAQVPMIVTAPWPVDQDDESDEEESEVADVNTTDLKEGVFIVHLEHDGYCEGDTLAGVFIAKPKQNLELTSLKAELVRQEATTEGLSNSQIVLLGSQALSGAVRLASGQRAEFPFRFELPIANLPSVETERAWSSTRVNVTLARPRARDLEASGYFALYSARR